MDTLTTTGALARDERGFSMMEVVVALFITSFSLLALAQVFTLNMRQTGTSQADLIAREKAAEAVESVFAARDSRTITWNQLRNVANGGVFLNGPQSLKEVGTDGLVNTADDGAVQSIVRPGTDNLLGTADDETVPLSTFQRTILISDVTANLRQIQVVLAYQANGISRSYTVTALISSFA